MSGELTALFSLQINNGMYVQVLYKSYKSVLYPNYKQYSCD